MGPKKMAAGADVREDGGAVTSSGQTKAKPKVVKVKTLSRPSTLAMVVEALKKNTERKGTSVPAIRSHILLAHPTVDPVRLRLLLRNALNKGIEKGILVRPPNSNASGATGRFKLAKPGAKPKVEGENMDPNVQPKTAKPKKKVVKVSKKPKAAKVGSKADENMEDKAADKKERSPEAKAAGSKPKKSAAEKTDKGSTVTKKPKAKALSAEEGAKPKKEPAKKKTEAAKTKDGEEKPTAKSSKKGRK
ncbi:histone H1.8 [Ranitomeya variabilis]|uniref:histone H1.8 n=1 Tax=Ranitomeya variabilis TaxID=490064 RepID=UPI004056B09C